MPTSARERRQTPRSVLSCKAFPSIDPFLMSALISSLNHSDKTWGFRGKIPSKEAKMGKTMMAEDQAGMLLSAIEARRLEKCSFRPPTKDHFADGFSDKPSPSFGNRAFKWNSSGMLRLTTPGMRYHARAACMLVFWLRPLQIAAVVFQPATAQLLLNHAHRACWLQIPYSTP